MTAGGDTEQQDADTPDHHFFEYNGNALDQLTLAVNPKLVCVQLNTSVVDDPDVDSDSFPSFLRPDLYCPPPADYYCLTLHPESEVDVNLYPLVPSGVNQECLGVQCVGDLFRSSDVVLNPDGDIWSLSGDEESSQSFVNRTTTCTSEDAIKLQHSICSDFVRPSFESSRFYLYSDRPKKYPGSARRIL